MQREKLYFTYDTFRLLVRDIEHFIPGRAHYHSALELIVAPELDVQVHIGGREYALPGSRAACIAPGTVHCTTVRPSRNNRYYCLQLRLEKVSLFGMPVGAEGRVPLFPEVDSTEIIRLLERLPRQEIGDLNPPSRDATSPALMAEHSSVLFSLLSLLIGASGQEMRKDDRHERVRRVIEYLEDHLSESFSLDALARSVSLSRFHLCRVFKSYTGMTITKYLHRLRIDRAKFQLLQEGATVTQAALSCGYVDPAHFIKAFKAHEGKTPKQWVRSSESAGRTNPDSVSDKPMLL